MVLGEDFGPQVDHALVLAPRRLLGAQRGRAGLAEGVSTRRHQLAHGAQHAARVARGHHQRLADLPVFEVVPQPLLLVVLLLVLLLVLVLVLLVLVLVLLVVVLLVVVLVVLVLLVVVLLMG